MLDQELPRTPPPSAVETTPECFRVRVVCALRTDLSAGRLGRELSRGLVASGLEVAIDERLESDHRTDYPLPIELRSRLDVRGTADVDFTIVEPEAFPEVLRSPTCVAFLVFEATEWPAEWVAGARRHVQRVVVPSSFCRKTLSASGFPHERIDVVPHGIDAQVFCPGDRVRSRQPLRLAFVGTPSRRKGLDILLHALPLAFPDPGDVELAIKTTRWAARHDALGELADACARLRAQGYRIDHVTASWSDARLAEFLRAADVLCLPHRGEGFGLTALEAMACGTPVLATDWSGTRDFVDAEVGWPIPIASFTSCSGLLPARFRAPAAARMVEPSSEALIDLLRTIAADREHVRAKGDRAATRAAGWTWTRAARRLADVLLTARARSPA